MEERVLVLMPTARDGERTGRALSAAGIDCAVCRDVAELCREIASGAGAALLTEEAVEADHGGCLQNVLRDQPTWSDFPLIVLAREKEGGLQIRESLNATLVERPVRVRSLLSVLRAALRSRRRQYEVRDHLADRLRAEEALRQSEKLYRRAAVEAATAAEANAKFRTLFEQATQFAGILAPDGTVIEVNRLCLDACGFTREETLGRKFWECGWWSPSPELVETVRAACARAAAGAMFHAESRYFVADGSERFVDLIIAPVTDETGRVLFLNPTGTDVTEQKRSESELRKQSERLRLLWEAAAVLLTTAEPDAMMRELFAKIAPHFGLDTYFNFMVDETGEALRLESCLGIPDEAARAIRRLEFGQAVCGAVAQSRRPITVSYIQQSDDPRVQLVKGFGVRTYSCNPLLADDHLLGTLSFASRTRDAFDPDELEFLRTVCRYVTVAYERLRLVRELRDSDRKKDDFIALLAHELRNPLAPLRNGLQVLRLGNGDPRAGERARQMMDRQLTHMVRLVDDLLDVSRIGRNKMELRRQPVALADVIASAVETAQPAIDAAGHDLTVSVPPQPVYLHADLTRLAQVFSNLLTNSAKYTPDGGRIRLTAELRGDAVAVSVRDNGIGIPPASLPRIFDMFSQVDRSIERTTGGLGIGLALVKGLTEMHDGTVTAESSGGGSTFTVTLPILAAHPVSRTQAPETTPKSEPAGLRVLVVDDNRDGAESLSLMLEMVGHEVQTAYDGVEAVQRAESFRPDVVLMDVGMPRMNGHEATRRIRSQPWGQDMTIIALTGWGQSSDRALSRGVGCDGHLVKPVSLPDLEQKLAELFGTRVN
jgi:PAS domain S-box-containing protein